MRTAPAVRWWAPGDWNAFFGLALDNLGLFVIFSGLLIGVFGFPSDLVLGVMVPGTAVGVLLGNLVYTGLAVRLMRRTGRSDVTAMPFGLDTPSLFGIVFGVLGPAMLLTRDPVMAWKIGMGVTVAMGVIKLGCAFAGDWARRVVPRAALLGSIAGVAILLIAFLPSLRIFGDPLVGVVSLVVLLAALLGGVRMPWGLPGALAAVLAGTVIFWGRWALGPDAGAPGPHPAITLGALGLALPLPTLAWLDALDATLPYLPLAVPFALATVVGGIDNTESAIVAGDEYRTRDILLTEAIATIAAGCCGGVIQNTPYIGHPAYKKMGAGAGYAVATGLFVGLGGMLGFLPFLIDWIPAAAVAPILVYIGLEVVSQAYLATPERHGFAVSLALLPSVAFLVALEINSVLGGAGVQITALTGEISETVRTLALLGNGFIITALLWGAATAELIDGRFRRTGLYFLAAALLCLFGVIHSPEPAGTLFLPWRTGSAVPFHFAAAYLALGLTVVATSRLARKGAPAAGARTGRAG